MTRLSKDIHHLINETVLRILYLNNICHITDFLDEDINKLVHLTNLKIQDIIEIRNTILDKFTQPAISGCSLLAYNCGYVRLYIKELDIILNGGLPFGINEICGLPGFNKAQLCETICINVTSAELTTNVLYIDCKGDFSAMKLQKKMDESGFDQKDMIRIMNQVRVVRIWKLEDLVNYFQLIKNKQISIENTKLIIVNSMVSLMFQHLGENNKYALTLLNTFVNSARLIAAFSKLCILCVNIQTRWMEEQFAEDIDDNEVGMETQSKRIWHEIRSRCMGKYWQHIPKTVILLSKDFKQKKILKITVFKNSHGRSNVTCNLLLT